ncbi:PspC domain-containing protein [Heyndrickxia acidicola]|uniref:PspC domain-containing protein n=1 Tax=Heyndrickxia acidicola TaxID=209389 RepID=A0ABU6MHI3_9BACI|nr:PspC domain-containing protein [Heyndrickxia acidicola]MED1203759.1 PspC domain-containing protein [Heyndrickxia acidicola]
MKQLTRSRTNRKLAGVFGGLSDYFNVDANLLRIVFILVLAFTAFVPGFLVYVLSIFIIPNEEV